MAEAAAKTIIALRYRLVHELGKGGMGTVWKAHDDRLNRSVALKLMAKRLLADKTAVDRFEREAKAVARLLSPHIVQIYDYGIDPQPFMVMELLEGENVSQRLSRVGQLPLGDVAKLVGQAARGLATAHEEGVVHRDLKPGNLFIVRDREKEFLKVVDFGIAKLMRRQVTLTAITSHDQPVGTPQYMSPNQLRAKEDHRDDIWALAVIAYKALCGVHPFAADSLVTLVQRIMDDPHDPVTEYEPALPLAIDAVFSRAFEKDREERFQSALDFAEAFDAVAVDHAAANPDGTRNSAATLERTSVEPARASAHPAETPAHTPRNPRGHSTTPAGDSGEEEHTPTLIHQARAQSAPAVVSKPKPPARVRFESTSSTIELDMLDTGIDPSASPAGALNVPTPTPPPATGTPWPVAQPRRGRLAVGPIVAGVGLSLATFAIAAWLLLSADGPQPETPPDLGAQPAELPQRTDKTRESAKPRDPEPKEAPSATSQPAQKAARSATLPSASASVSAPPQTSAPPPVEPPVAQPPPSPAKKRRRTRKKKKSGDEAFENGPF